VVSDDDDDDDDDDVVSDEGLTMAMTVDGQNFAK
jgi:hypothetical protein